MNVFFRGLRENTAYDIITNEKRERTGLKRRLRLSADRERGHAARLARWEDRETVKRCLVWVCMLCMLAPCCLAEEGGWSPEQWAYVQAGLYAGEADPVPASLQIAVQPDQVEAASDLPDTWMHILVLGTDSPDMQRYFGQAAALMLVSIHTQTGQVRALSLPEYAVITVEGLPDKVMLRHVNCFGGPLLTMRELNRTLRLNIRLYCAMNLGAFAAAMDAMGGVQLTLSEHEAQVLGLEAGSHVLNGEQCLRYAKIRTAGDGGVRVQKLLAAAVSQTLGTGSLTAVFGLADRIIGALETNMSLAEIISTAMTVLDHSAAGAMESRDVPREDDGSLGPEAARICREFIYREGE